MIQPLLATAVSTVIQQVSPPISDDTLISSASISTAVLFIVITKLWYSYQSSQAQLLKDKGEIVEALTKATIAIAKATEVIEASNALLSEIKGPKRAG